MREYGYYPWLYPTNFLLGMLGFNSLSLRREACAATHFFRLLRGSVENSDILEKINFYVPNDYRRQRHHRLFYLPACRTNLQMISPVGRGIQLLNRIISDIDIFHISEEVFKKVIFLIIEKMSLR